MKTIFLAVIMMHISIAAVYAQNKQEIGIRINNYDWGLPNGIGFIYKKEVVEKVEKSKSSKNTNTSSITTNYKNVKPINKPTTNSTNKINRNTSRGMETAPVKPSATEKFNTVNKDSSIAKLKPIGGKNINAKNINSKPGTITKGDKVITKPKPVNSSNNAVVDNSTVNVIPNNAGTPDLTNNEIISKPTVLPKQNKKEVNTKNAKKNQDITYNRYRFSLSGLVNKIGSENIRQSIFSTTGAYGGERRSKIANGFYVIYGYETALSYVVEKSSTAENSFKNELLVTTAGDIMGLQYEINNQFNVGVESFSGVSNTINITNIANTEGRKYKNADLFNFNPNASFAITVSYKF